MERIEIRRPEVYFVARDNRKFQVEADCARYEYLLDKYMNAARHIVCEDGDGHQQHFFYAYTREEVEEISDWSYWFLGYRCKLPTTWTWDLWEGDWIWLPPDHPEGYGPVPDIKTVTDFINFQEECLKSYQLAIKSARQIKNASRPEIRRG